MSSSGFLHDLYMQVFHCNEEKVQMGITGILNQDGPIPPRGGLMDASVMWQWMWIPS